MSHAGFIPFFLLARTEMLSISESQTMDVKVQKVGKQLCELWWQCLYCTDNKNGEAESNQLLHFSNSDLAGTLTQDLRNRNPTLYTTKLRGLNERKGERWKRKGILCLSFPFIDGCHFPLVLWLLFFLFYGFNAWGYYCYNFF